MVDAITLQVDGWPCVFFASQTASLQHVLSSLVNKHIAVSQLLHCKIVGPEQDQHGVFRPCWSHVPADSCSNSKSVTTHEKLPHQTVSSAFHVHVTVHDLLDPCHHNCVAVHHVAQLENSVPDSQDALWLTLCLYFSMI